MSQDGARESKSRLTIGAGMEKKKQHLEQLRTDNFQICIFYLPTATMAPNKWTTCALDVKKAFLLSDGIHQPVYISPPREAETSIRTLWKLNVAAHGLAASAVEW